MCISCVLQRTSEQEESEGNSEGLHTAVQRAPWYRVHRRVLRLMNPHQPEARPSVPDSWMLQQCSHVPPSVKINDCNETPPHIRARPAESCHTINRQTWTPWWLYTCLFCSFLFCYNAVSLNLSYLTLILHRCSFLLLRAALRACQHTQQLLSLSCSPLLEFPVVSRLFLGD